jgi:hypothetical protein
LSRPFWSKGKRGRDNSATENWKEYKTKWGKNECTTGIQERRQGVRDEDMKEVIVLAD